MMKKLLYVLLSGALFACSTSTQLTQFNKQKYTKKFHAKKVKFDDKINSYAYKSQSINNTERAKLALSEDNHVTRFEHLYKPTLSKLIDTKQRNFIKSNNEDKNSEIITENKPEVLENIHTSINDKLVTSNINETTINSSSFSPNLLLVIIAILLPPLAVLLYEGATSRFWIDLLLTFLFFIPGIIYAIIVIWE